MAAHRTRAHSSKATVSGGWRKSSLSGNDGGNCVEWREHGQGDVEIRDSKDPGGPTLAIPADQRASFIDAVRSGRLAS
jgi:hypothetical protein